MCDFSRSLIAWLDQELPPREAANLERHIRVCAECQRQAELFRRFNETFDAYCEVAIAAKVNRHWDFRVWRHVVPATAALATAAVLILFLFKPAGRLPQIPAQSQVLPTAALEKTPALIPMGKEPVLETSVENRAAIAKPKSLLKNRQWPGQSAFLVKPPARGERELPYPAPVYIAIPADALFPPGAFPDGVGFVADVNWRPDGSPQRLRLQPQLVGLQRREAQP